VYVAEAVAQRAVALNQCDLARHEIDRLLQWTPHHLGPARAAARCRRP
jgi:hypothetical protein